jgi:hypothetical protein
MARRNRVSPFGDLHAVDDRGLFTGNRGCLVDGDEAVVRHHRSALWITCLLRYRDWRVPLARPERWTPIFFLDDAVSLAAGHRPCGLCRRGHYLAYRDGATRAAGATRPLRAHELDRRLAGERLRRGRGIDRATDRRIWEAEIGDLPVGSVVVDDAGRARVLLHDRMLAFTFAGWVDPVSRPGGGIVRVLTPPTSVGALAHGFVPVLHPSAGTGGSSGRP